MRRGAVVPAAESMGPVCRVRRQVVQGAGVSAARAWGRGVRRPCSGPGRPSPPARGAALRAGRRRAAERGAGRRGAAGVAAPAGLGAADDRGACQPRIRRGGFRRAVAGSGTARGGAPRAVPLPPLPHHRLAKRRPGDRLRFLPLHLALEGCLALHFGGPSTSRPGVPDEVLHPVALPAAVRPGPGGQHIGETITDHRSPITGGRSPTSRRSGSPTPRSAGDISCGPWPGPTGSWTGRPPRWGRAGRS
ncbi:ARPP-2 domain-containing protein [Streptomyces anulatus]